MYNFIEGVPPASHAIDTLANHAPDGSGQSTIDTLPSHPAAVIHGAPAAGEHTDVAPPAPPVGPSPEAAPDAAPSIEDAAQGHGPVHIAHPERLTASIDKHGEGAFEMWKDMQQKLIDEGYSVDGNDTPPTIRHILESNPRALANEYEFHYESDDTIKAEAASCMRAIP